MERSVICYKLMDPNSHIWEEVYDSLYLVTDIALSQMVSYGSAATVVWLGKFTCVLLLDK